MVLALHKNSLTNHLPTLSKNNLNIDSKEYKNSYRYSSRKSWFGFSLGSSSTNFSSIRNQRTSLYSKNNIKLSGKRVTLKNANIKADNNIVLNAQELLTIKGAINKSNYSHHENRGGIFKKIVEDTIKKTTYAGSSIQAGNNLSLSATQINIIGSKIKANQADITTQILNVISAKDTNYESHFSDKSGILTRTIISQGHIKDTAVESSIKVGNKIVFNGKTLKDSLNSNNILKTITSQNPNLTNAQINQIKAKLQSQEWYQKTKTISQMGQIIVQAIVTVMTGGTATAATQATMEAAVKAAVNAAIKNLVRQALTQLITSAITGNGLKLDLDSMIKGAVKAGVVSYADSFIDLKVVDHDTSEFAQKVQDTVLTTGVQTAVYGGSYIDNLKNNVVNNETMKATEKMFAYIGHKSSIRDNLPAKTIIHGLVGGVASKLRGGDFTSGAIATATSHVVGGYVRDLLLKNPNISEKDLENRIIAISRVVGGAAALSTGKNLSEKDITIAQDMSESVVKNNVLFLIPIIYAALEVTDKAIDAYDMYQLAKAVESGDDKKVKELSTTIAIGLATEGIPGNKILQKVSKVFKSSKLGKGIKNVENYDIKNAKETLSWAEQSGTLRKIVKNKGNFGIGKGTTSDANKLGKAWVGNGYRIASDGKTLVSKNGLRTYRPPSKKPNSSYATTGKQANFEEYELIKINGKMKKRPIRNGHLDIID